MKRREDSRRPRPAPVLVLPTVEVTGYERLRWTVGLSYRTKQTSRLPITLLPSFTSLHSLCCVRVSFTPSPLVLGTLTPTDTYLYLPKGSFLKFLSLRLVDT